MRTTLTLAFAFLDRQDEHVLTVGEIRARHDFTLLLLQRVWQAPWLPETHASFQPRFRDAVKAVALCTHRLGFPHDTMVAVCSFLNRDWWEEPRKKCWTYECLCEQSFKTIEQRFSHNTSIDSPAAVTPEYCPHCRVAMYCSKECRDKDFKVGHKKKCCRPPFSSTAPDKEELQLCVEILKDSVTPLPPFLTSRSTAGVDIVGQVFAAPDGDTVDDEMGDVDDDGSWETVESGDEETKEAEGPTIPKTARIYKFFKDRAYNLKS
jgi:hypothetical protein